MIGSLLSASISYGNALRVSATGVQYTVLGFMVNSAEVHASLQLPFVIFSSSFAGISLMYVRLAWLGSDQYRLLVMHLCLMVASLVDIMLTLI